LPMRNVAAGSSIQSPMLEQVPAASHGAIIAPTLRPPVAFQWHDRGWSGRPRLGEGTMDDVLEDDLRDAATMATSLWWLVILAGLAWFLVSLVVLRFDTTSVTTVGILLGFVLLGAGANELMAVAVMPSWRWIHGFMAVLFLAGAIWAFVSPDDAFWSLASVLGLLLVLKGTMDIVIAAETRGFNPLWGLALATGIIEVLLGFWASQQYYPARAALILIWVAFMAMFRGIADLVLGVQLRAAHKRLDPT
jgi:uncharacterized membrane protein HdeD (DUF308 family)